VTIDEPASSPFAAQWAAQPAIIVEPSGRRVTFGELDSRSMRVARHLRDGGASIGSTIAILMENRAEFLETAWAAQRAGLRYVGVNSHLTAPEVAHILADCEPMAVVTSAALAPIAVAALPVSAHLLVMVDRPREGFDDWADYESMLAQTDDAPLPDQCEGDFMLYSSGTSGRPKGIERPLGLGPLGSYPDVPGKWLAGRLGMVPGDVYLCPAPLYHAAPLAWSMGTHRQGSTVVVMESFDAQQALSLIERHGVTHSQWVATMFVRMLKLDESVRRAHDLSTLRAAVHAAAPCPVEVKRAMIDWWGPILYEFYSNTEGVGATFITSDEWMAHPGSVGRPALGRPLIADDDGAPQPPGEVGTIWFADIPEFAYHGAAVDAPARRDHPDGYFSVGDLGYLDDDGYLYLVDRRSDLIIAGGVNIYPREIEDALIMAPGVLDVAVVGAAHESLGRVPVALIVPSDPDGDADALVGELAQYCRERLAGFKQPRRIDVVDSLPRTPTGKLRKHELTVEV